MPMYDFQCEKCGKRFTVLVSMNERNQVSCPDCRSTDVRQLISSCSVRTGSSCTPGTNSSFTRSRG